MDILSKVLTIIYVLTIIVTVIMLLLENRNPIRTQAWIVVLIFFPVGGLILYLFFGENMKRQLAYRKKRRLDELNLDKLAINSAINLGELEANMDLAIRDKFSIIKMLSNDTRSLLTDNNQVEIFNNGKTKFESLLKDIEEAKSFIHLEYYILADDEIGSIVKKALISKADQGVEVRVLFDDMGSLWIGKEYINELRRAGVKIFAFMPVWFSKFTRKVNYRNHRKIVVIDGKIAYVGGMNIADRYIDGDSYLGNWRDTHLRLKGGAVKSLQTLFLIDWYYASNEEFEPEDIDKFYPNDSIGGGKLVQIISNGPDTPDSSVMEAHFMAIAKAKSRICISTPYLLPTSTLLTALRTAALSGVDVQIIIPTRSDARVAHYASQSYIDKLLKAGVKVYQYVNGFTHAKVMVVDDDFSSVGSANMDYRSFEQNFEVNALVYDKEINEALYKDFEADIKNSKELILSEWKKRPLKDKLIQSLARVLAPLF